MMIDVHCPKGGRHRMVWVEDTFGDLVIQCEKCAYMIPDDDHIFMLNAALQLTADEAEVRASKFEKIGGIFSVDKRLRGYARTWRGDTEEFEDE